MGFFGALVVSPRSPIEEGGTRSAFWGNFVEELP
jgi:hypothetical protein